MKNTRFNLRPRDIGEALALALLLEASGTPKPGNVHKLRDRPDLKYEAFLATGVLAIKYFERGVKRGIKPPSRLLVGDLVYGLIKDVVDKARSTNTCLGSSLLLSIISVATGRLLTQRQLSLSELGESAIMVVKSTTVYDAIYYYKAIRKASPSYLKPTDFTGDYVNVWDRAYRKKLMSKGHNLYDVLKYASTFDVVSDEAISGLRRGFEAVKFLQSRLEVHRDLNRGIVETYLYLLSRNLDTIVLLKHGVKVAERLMDRAKAVLNEVLQNEDKWMKLVLDLDVELYNNGINPGSIADLVAETIGLYLLQNLLEHGTLFTGAYY